MPDVAIDRPLTDPERYLLLHLAAKAVAEQAGCSIDRAGDALYRAAEGGKLTFIGDASVVDVVVAGKTLVHCTREWLAWTASFGGDDP